MVTKHTRLENPEGRVRRALYRGQQRARSSQPTGRPDSSCTCSRSRIPRGTGRCQSERTAPHRREAAARNRRRQRKPWRSPSSSAAQQRAVAVGVPHLHPDVALRRNPCAAHSDPLHRCAALARLERTEIRRKGVGPLRTAGGMGRWRALRGKAILKSAQAIRIGGVQARGCVGCMATLIAAIQSLLLGNQPLPVGTAQRRT